MSEKPPLVLAIVSGPQVGKTRILLDGLETKNKLIFGRHRSCDHVLRHSTVSRAHFAIEKTAGKLFVVDQDSENGTFVNDMQISWVELKPGDTIKAGPFVLTLEHSVDPNTESLVHSGLTPQQIAHQAPAASATENYLPREYMEGITYFNSGHYFEAHEIWEEIWLRSQGTEKTYYQMLIQAAVGLHHYERGNAIGARGMHARVVDKLNTLPSLFMSVDLVEFSNQYKAFFQDLIEHGIEAAPAPDRQRPRITLLIRDRE